MIRFIKSFHPKYRYTYGKTINPETGTVHGELRRFDNRTRKLELLLWKAGEHNHKRDFWCECGGGWVDWFVSNEEQPK